MGRGTAAAVDIMILVVEPGRRSIDIGLQIIELAEGLGIPRIETVANKVRGQSDLDMIGKEMGGRSILGHIPFSAQAIEADMTGQALFDLSPEIAQQARQIVARLDEFLAAT
jgi:CO dehydrogenase maturation factor